MGLRRHVDLLEGNLFKNMALFCVPVIFTNCLQILYNAADIMVVGKFGSDVALSGVSASTSLINLIVNFFIGLSVGINVIVANKVGAGDREGAKNGVNTAVFLALFGGIIAAAIGFFSCEAMLKVMNTPENTLPQAIIYVKIYFLGVPGILMTNFGSSILRSIGDTKRPLYFMTLSGFINVILNLILVIVFHLDAAGVAIATSVSNYASAALILISLTKIEGICRLDLKHLKFHFKSAVDIARIGIPSGINSCMYALSNTLIQSSINTFGDYAVAGNGIATNLDNILSMSQASVYHAAMTFTSQNHGAKKYQRFRPIFFNALLLDLIIWFFIGGTIFLFRRPLLGLFSNNSAVIEYAIVKVGILIPGFLIGGFMDVSTGCLRGLGRSTVPMIVSIVGVCAFRVLWVYTAFASFPTLETLYISYPVSWAITFIANSSIYFFIMNKVTKQLKSEM